MTISLTDRAAERIKTFIEKRGTGVGLRLGVKTTGCSGLAYVVEYADDVGVGDMTFEDKGVTVVINAKSLAYIDGVEVDFTREGLNEGFRFNNPHEKSRCGCGESFSV